MDENLQNNQNGEKGNGFGIASLILGIMAIVGIIFIIPTIVCGILSIIFGIISLVQKRKIVMPLAGIILSSIAILICVCIFVFAVNFFADNGNLKDVFNTLEIYKQNDSKDSPHDVVSGNSWIETHDESYLVLNNNGTFKYYKNKNDLSNYYYEGTYKVYNGEEAIEYVSNDLSRYNYTEDEQRNLIAKNKQYTVDNYYCMVLNNEKCIIDGKNTATSTVITPYVGFYYENVKTLDFSDMNNGTYFTFTLDE